MAYVGLDGKTRYADKAAYLRATQGGGQQQQQNPFSGAGLDLFGLRQQLGNQLGLPGLQDTFSKSQQQVANFQFSDLANVFRQESQRLGLGRLAEDIAGLTTERQSQQRTLEDLPETIREGTEDVGLSTAQLGRQSAAESRPIIRNISDLLGSISVLGQQRQSGLEEAKFASEAVGNQEQQQFGQLQNQLGIASQNVQSAEGQLGQLFQGAVSQREQEQQRQFQTQQLQQQQQFAAEQGNLDRQNALQRTNAGITSDDAAEFKDASDQAQAQLDQGNSVQDVGDGMLNKGVPASEIRKIPGLSGYKSPAQTQAEAGPSFWERLFGGGNKQEQQKKQQASGTGLESLSSFYSSGGGKNWWDSLNF